MTVKLKKVSPEIRKLQEERQAKLQKEQAQNEEDMKIILSSTNTEIQALVRLLGWKK